jgi:ATP-binding cassette, subfamily B, bacterial
MKTSTPNPSLPTWKFVAHLIRNQGRTYTLHFIFSILIFTEQLAPGLIAKGIFDRLSGAIPAAGQARLGLNPLWWLVILYVLIEVIRLFAAIGYEWFGMTFRLLNCTLLGSNLFASILRRRGDQPLPVSPGEALNRFRYDEDLGEVTDFPTWIPDQVSKWIAAAVAIVIMARINLTITLVIFLPLLGTIFLTRLFWGQLLELRRQGLTAADAASGFQGEAFGAVQALKVAGAEEDAVTHLTQLNERRRQIELRVGLFSNLLNALNSSVVKFGTGVILLLAGSAISAGTFTVGDFALFLSYLWFTTQVPSEIGTFYGDYKTQAVSIERLLELVRPQPVAALTEFHPVYAHGPLPEVPFPTKAPGSQFETLEISGLTYQHAAAGNGDTSENSQTVEGAASIHQINGRGIRNIHFTLRRGELVVITGRVGSGKSTLVRVLLGLLSKHAGEIRWNGQLVADPAAFFRPPRVAYTSQVPRLFSQTLRENILMGLPEDRVDLPGAIRLSVLEQDVADLEKGLDTLVGPRGVRLSGGQVQRAAAARMLVRAPDLLVFDDLSSALDVETERLLWDRLLERGKDKGERVKWEDEKDKDEGEAIKEKTNRMQLSLTSPFILHPSSFLVVSHRKAALQRADRIVVLKDGQVEAEGKLSDLLETCAEMRRIWSGELED